MASLERKRKKMAKVYHTDVDNIRDDDIEAYYRDKKKKRGRALAAGVGFSAGTGLIGSTAANGYITGRHRLYHTTDADNVKKIKEEGLKAYGKHDREAYVANNTLSQGRNLGFIDKEPDKAVYLTKNKQDASLHGVKRKAVQSAMGKQPKKQERMKVSIPHEQYKKMNFVDNPELLGAKSKKEFVNKRREMENIVDEVMAKATGHDYSPQRKPLSDFVAGRAYKNTVKNSRVVPHDISSKYIKGGKGYEKLSLKEIKEYMKKNPKRVAKGLGLYGLAGASLASSVGLTMRNHNQRKRTKTLSGLRQMEGLPQSNEKRASCLLNDMYMEKTAVSLQSVGNTVRNAKNRYVDLLRGDTMRKNKAIRDNTAGVVKALKDNRDAVGGRVAELQEIVDLHHKNYKNLSKDFDVFKKNNNLDALKQEIGKTKDYAIEAEKDLEKMKKSNNGFMNGKTKSKFIESYEKDLENARKAHEQAKVDYRKAKNDYHEEYNRRISELQHADSNLKAKRTVLDDKKKEVNDLSDKVNKENDNLTQARKDYGAEAGKHYATVGGTIGAGVFGLNKGRHAIYDKIKGKDKDEGGK